MFATRVKFAVFIHGNYFAINKTNRILRKRNLINSGLNIDISCIRHCNLKRLIINFNNIRRKAFVIIPITECLGSSDNFESMGLILTYHINTFIKDNILRKVRNHRNNRASGCFQILICRRCKIIRKLANQTTGKRSLCHFKASVDNSILELCVIRYSRSVILDISTFHYSR